MVRAIAIKVTGAARPRVGGRVALMDPPKAVCDRCRRAGFIAADIMILESPGVH
jgi:hypothetical protein